jgi:ubiquinone/menaquinone biosynthesis C-methylase UbiE
MPYFDGMEYKHLVREGYDRIAGEYLAERTSSSGGEDVLLLDELVERVPSGADVLDAGCGAGVPVTKMLSQFFNVTGIDFSESQIALARQLVPDAQFLCEEITRLSFDDNSFDVICSYYAIIHIPRHEHQGLLENFHRMVKPSGYVLLCLGANDLDDDIDYFHGVTMYWSHYDAETYRQMMIDTGFELIRAKEVADAMSPGTGHLFVLGRKVVG